MRLAAESDTRIVCLRHEENRGVYAARNTALRHATGEFITVHDADNWSHPQKFAVQLVDLLESGAAFNTTVYLGVDWQMRVEMRPWNHPWETLRESFPSLTFKRKDAITLGGWDQVRMAGDDEMYHRLMALHREERRKLLDDVPLSFNLLTKRNITNQKFTGLSSLFYGARREYRDAFRYWHSVEESAQPKLVMTHQERPFPAPAICRIEPSETLIYDVLLVSDYSLVGGAASSNMEVISAANRQGLRVACFHWPLFDNASSPLNPDVRALIHLRAVECVVAGENVDCDLVVVVQPAILHCVPDLLPQIQTRSCIIRTERVIKFDLHRVIETAQGVFNVEPEMAPPTMLFECPQLAAGLSKTCRPRKPTKRIRLRQARN
jgi:hypothetical protein